jgi:hypothetical protein
MQARAPLFNSPPALGAWRADNPARSRLSGGFGLIRTRPPKFLCLGDQPSLNRILLDIIADPIKLRIGSDQTIEAFLLPKRSMSTEQKIGLMACESFEGTQPFAGNHMRSNQKMNMIRHHDERMQLISLQFPFPMPQSRHHHLRNFFAPQRQRSIRASIQQPVDSHERLTRRDQSGRWKYPVARQTAVQPECDKHPLPDHVPMGQPSFIMPHTPTWYVGDRETFTASSRLKAGCGQDCPPSNSGWNGLEVMR